MWVLPTPTEAINGVIKQVNRQGRGYSFPTIKTKLLYLLRRRITEGTGITPPEQGAMILNYGDMRPEDRPTYTLEVGS
jgi:hypothetical protein